LNSPIAVARPGDGVQARHANSPQIPGIKPQFAKVAVISGMAADIGKTRQVRTAASGWWGEATVRGGIIPYSPYGQISRAFSNKQKIRAVSDFSSSQWFVRGLFVSSKCQDNQGENKHGSAYTGL